MASSSSQPSSDKTSKVQQLQLLQTKPTKLLPIINSFTRQLISKRESEEKQEKSAIDEERLRDSLDKLRTGKFVNGASTASGELAFDIQDCMPLKWYRENKKTLWISLIPDDLITPSKDIAPRQGIFAKAIKDSIHSAMHDCPKKSFKQWFSSKGQILSPVTIDVNNANPNDITAIFCPPAEVACPNLIELIKTLEAAVPIPYKPDARPKKPGVFFISFSEFNPLDDVTVLALSFHVTFNAEAVRKDFERAADIIIAFFETKGIHLSLPEFQLTLPHPTKDDKESMDKTFPAKILITFNATDIESLKKVSLEVGRLHGTTIDVPDSTSRVPNFWLRTHCKLFEHRIETERPLWTKDIIEILHTEAQIRAAQNIESVLKMLFCRHHIDERGDNIAGIRKRLNLNEADNLALTNDKLINELRSLAKSGVLQISPIDDSLFALAPMRRKWRGLKLILIDHSLYKIQQRDLGLHLTPPFGLPFDHPTIYMACFYLTTSSAALVTYNNPRVFTTYELWKYMMNRFKQFKAFFESTPESVINSYTSTLERVGAIEQERMTPTFLFEYGLECAASSVPNSFVNPLAAVCLAFPSELKRFNWFFLQMKDKIETTDASDIISELQMIYHIKSDTVDAKTIFIKYVGSFGQGESHGHFISLNVPPNKIDDFTAKLTAIKGNCRYISIHSTWKPELLNPFPIKEAQHLIYESPITEIIEINSSQSQVIDSSQPKADNDSGRPSSPAKSLGDTSLGERSQSTHDEEEQTLTSVLQHFELISTRLNIAFSRLHGYSTLDCSTIRRDILLRRIDELNILNIEINSHIQQAIDLKSQFPADSHDNPDDLNPHKALEKMDETAQQKIQIAEILLSKFKNRLSELQALPSEKASQPKARFIPISKQILRIRSSFVVDSISTDIETDSSTRRLRFLDTFWVLPTRNSKMSFYHSVLIACSQDQVKQHILQGERSHFSYLLTKEITNDVVSLFEQTTKAMFRGFADCAICSTSNTTFNDYLERKNAPKNIWEAMPEDHFLCTPSLVAQAWQLNILVVWKRKGITRVFALPHGLIESPIIPILFSADKSFLDSHGNPSIVASPTANRFYPLMICEDKADSWESTFTAEPTEPDSAQSTNSPIITASFVKKIDKEFAFQSSIFVDGPGKNGKEVSGDESSERTIDGLSEESHSIMQAFLDDQSGDDDSGPPSYNPVLEQVDKEMAMRKLTEANLTMFKKIRRRRILDDDDEDLVPMIRIERSNPPSRSTPPVGTANRSAPHARGGGSIAQEKPKRILPMKPSDGKNAAATTGSAGRSSSK